MIGESIIILFIIIVLILDIRKGSKVVKTIDAATKKIRYEGDK